VCCVAGLRQSGTRLSSSRFRGAKAPFFHPCAFGAREEKTYLSRPARGVEERPFRAAKRNLETLALAMAVWYRGLRVRFAMDASAKAQHRNILNTALKRRSSTHCASLQHLKSYDQGCQNAEQVMKCRSPWPKMRTSSSGTGLVYIPPFAP
jgi:hypothetical protein